MQLKDLQGKVAVITGGAGVLCSSIARAFSACGARCAILDLDKEKAEEVAKGVKQASGIEAEGFFADVLDKEKMQKVREEVQNKFGKLDILINGAGGNAPQATTKVEFLTRDNLQNLEDTFFGLNINGFKKVLDLNFMGTLIPTLVFAQDMLDKGGSIINISSMSAFRPLTKVGAYSAAKAAVSNFTQWLAVHFARMKIRVNAIAPGFFLTAQNRFLLMDEKGNLTARGKKIISATPMEKFGEVEDLHGAVLFLASEMSSFITGIVLPIDGGFNAYSI